MASAVTLGLVVQSTRYVCVCVCLRLWWGPDRVLLLLRSLDLVVGVISRESRLALARQSPELTAHMAPKFLGSWGGTQDRWCLTLVQVQRTMMTADAISGLQQGWGGAQVAGVSKQPFIAHKYMTETAYFPELYMEKYILCSRTLFKINYRIYLSSNNYVLNN